MKVLHIVASPRGKGSNTLRVSQEFLNGLIAESDDLTVETIDLFRDDLPAVAGANIESRYQLMAGRSVDIDHEESWKHIEVLIDGFLDNDVVLISTPMWNFSIPYVLKYYIDCLVQPGYTFTYDAGGNPVPMVKGKRLVIITSRGSDYSLGNPAFSYDHQEPYLRTIFGFIGVDDIEFIHAQPMNVSQGRKETALADAGLRARTLAARIMADETVIA